jgi:hypothetical protein
MPSNERRRWDVLSIILGVMTIGLGAKAFTPGGLPLTWARSLTGGLGREVGVACIVLGALLMADGVLGTARLLALVSGRAG